MQSTLDIHRSVFSAPMSVSLPRIRIRQGRDRHLVQIECPGYLPEELELLIDSDVMRLRGKKRFRTHREAVFPFSDSFQYTIPFGYDLTEASIKSLYTDGILNILVSRIKSRNLTGVRTIYIEAV